MTVGEMSSTNIENCIKYTNPENKELDMVFNFHHLKVDYNNGKKWELMPFDFKALKELFFTWQVEMEEGNGWNALFWCNHDQPRALSRFGNDTTYRVESAKMLGTAIHLMRGTPYIYQGEEIGMTNPNFESIEEFRDVESLNAYEILLKKGVEEKEVLNILNNRSRDNSRTPMQWNSEKNGGFTKGRPWINVAKNYTEINVESEEKDENSILNYHKQLIKLREENDVISEGKFIPILEDHPQVLAYIREKDNKKIIVLCNFYEEKISVDLEELNNANEILLSNSDENKIEGNKVFLGPYGTITISVNS